MLSSTNISVAILAALSLLEFAVGYEQIVTLEEAKHLLSGGRLKRSVEGGNCTAATTPTGLDSCTSASSAGAGLAYTRCDTAKLRCVCDQRVATKFLVTGIYSLCVPLNFVSLSGGKCIPSPHDMCNLQVPGSKCATTDGNVFFCQCKNKEGIFPNCNGARLNNEQICVNNTGCAPLANSICANISADGYGTCQCPGTEGMLKDPGLLPPTTSVVNQALFNSVDNKRCVPKTCPPAGSLVSPCIGDPNFYTCVNIGNSYYCQCKAFGRSHNATMSGICCKSGEMPCADYSKCLPNANFCDNNVECPDCSDEKQFYCSGPFPSNPSCLPMNRSDRSRLEAGQFLEMLSGSGGLTDARFAQGKSFKDLRVVQTNNKPVIHADPSKP